jgi:hypothetical protein
VTTVQTNGYYSSGSPHCMHHVPPEYSKNNTNKNYFHFKICNFFTSKDRSSDAELCDLANQHLNLNTGTYTDNNPITTTTTTTENRITKKPEAHWLVNRLIKQYNFQFF